MTPVTKCTQVIVKCSTTCGDDDDDDDDFDDESSLRGLRAYVQFLGNGHPMVPNP